MSLGEKDASPAACGETLTSPHEGRASRSELLPAEPGRYEVESELARGGLGRILVAHDRRLGRPVALKESLDRDDPRLVREAFITARLQHPSIVPVHDAGRWPDGEPFFAMTRLAGRSLRAVIDERTTMRERLALLPAVIAVADAVAYAHSQGIIHRDLKPANVIIGDFGETVVIDWGLARSVKDGGADRPAPGSMRALSAGETRTGDVLGTPAYMAPEQARGEPADERADVYALGGILYHVLAGRPPHACEDDRLVVPLLTRQPDAPAELAAIVGKALTADRAQRYASAAEVAEDLKRFQTGKLVAAHRYSLPTLAWRWLRRRALPAAALGGLVAVAAGIALTWRWQEHRHPAVCSGFERALAGVWDDARRAEVQAAFARTGSPLAAPVYASVAAALDAHAVRWVARRRDACEATHVRGEQSPAALDLRMGCFDERRGELGALVGVLASSDARGVARAPQLLTTLSSLARCDDVAALAAVVPPPSDPVAGTRVEALRVQVAIARFLARAGRYPSAEPIAAAIAAEAQSIGYRPLEADARKLLGDLRWALGDAVAGEHEARLAIWAADEGRSDETRARALISLLFFHSAQARYVEAHDEARSAAAVITRLGQSSDLWGQLYEGEATVYRDEHKLAEARALLDKALAALDVNQPGDGYKKISVLLNLTNVLSQLGLADEAIKAGERARGIAESFPAGTAAQGLLLNSIGLAYEKKGDLDKATELYRKSIDVIERQLGANHRDAGYGLFNLGNVENMKEDWAPAIEHHQRALEIFEATFGPEHPQVMQALGGLGLSLLGAGRRAEALAAFEKAERMLRPDEGRPEVLMALGRGLLDAGGDRERAVRLVQAARAAAKARGLAAAEPEAWLAKVCTNPLKACAQGGTP